MMADENYEERNAIGPTDEGAHFFAHLEILGLARATRKAWEKIAYEFARGKHEGWGMVMRSANIDSAEWLRGRYLLPYDIPFEVGDCIKYNAINWNYNPNDGLSEDVVRKAFEGPCSTYDSDIESKQEKTLQFFECSQRAALTRKFSCLEVP